MLLAGCGGPVEIDVPDLSAEEQDACDAFAADLPDTLADLERVESEPEDAPAAAYGDPAIVVTCGVDEPEGFGPGASCEIANRVRWYIPADEYGDEPRDLTITSAWNEPRVQVFVPADHWPEGGAGAMAALAPVVREHLPLTVKGKCL